MIITQIIGWLGAIAYILAYLLLSIEILKSGSTIFHGLNALGALYLIINAIPINDYPTIVVNIVWGIIATISTIRTIRKDH